jgi:two-component system LytT family response regulator
MSIRILIVDDEPLARDGVAFQLRNESDVDIVGQCENGSEAVRAIAALKPDLVFLDIRMPKVSGFDVIEQVGAARMPLVIFLTAYDEYAIEAFHRDALDYLLKPIEPKRFQQSLQKARKALATDRLAAQGAQVDKLLAALASLQSAAQKAEQTAAQTAQAPRIALKLSGQVHFLRPDELKWIEAEGDYVNVHTQLRSHLVKETMQALEKRLEPHGFLRIHRSAIVNLDKIAKLVAADNGDYEVLLNDGLSLKVGRNYRDALFARMKVDS